MEELINILENIVPGVDFKIQKGLVDNDILDSLSIVSLISAIDTEFDVEIPVSEIIPENFDSAESIYELIKKIQKEQ